MKNNIWRMNIVDIRHFATDRHRSVDAPCVGGGPGMVLRPDVLHAALEHTLTWMNAPRFLYLSPRGQVLHQTLLQQWAQQAIFAGQRAGASDGVCAPHAEWVVLCGRFEGVDERVLTWWNFEEYSLGDFILCGGEVAAMAMVESFLRLIPGVVGNAQSLTHDSFSWQGADGVGTFCPLLEHPLYTHPMIWKGQCVPKVLQSGNHGAIARWRYGQSLYTTWKKRPNLWRAHMAAQGTTCHTT